MRYPFALLTVLCLCLLGSAQARTLADPIVGKWREDGSSRAEVKITAHGTSGFTGTLTKFGRYGAYDPLGCFSLGQMVFTIGPARAGALYPYKGALVVRDQNVPADDQGHKPCKFITVRGAVWQIESRHDRLHQSCLQAPPECHGNVFDRVSKPSPEPTGGRVEFGFNANPGTSHAGPGLGPGYKITYGLGDLTFDGTEVKKQKDPLLFGYGYSNGKELEVHLLALDLVGESDLAGPVKSVVLRVAVESSQLPGCTVGQRGTLRLWDDGSTHDKIILAICGRTRSYADSPEDRLYVQIKPS